MPFNQQRALRIQQQQVNEGTSSSEPEQIYAEIDEITQNVSKININRNTQNENFERSSEIQSASIVPKSIPSNSSHSKETTKCLAAHIEPMQVMGQSLSQRRPRLSLTWVLRDHHQLQQQQTSSTTIERNVSVVATTPINTGAVVTTVPRTLEKKKFRSKSKDCVERLFSEKYGNAGSEYDKESVYSLHKSQQHISANNTSDLMFVCSKSSVDNGSFNGGYDSQGDSGGIGRHSERSRKSEKFKRVSKLSFKNNLNNNNNFVEKSTISDKVNNFKEINCTIGLPVGSKQQVVSDDVKSINGGIKATYSEPSLCTGEAGQSRRHRHRRRRERNRSQRFGYEIKNVDDFLSKVKYNGQLSNLKLIVTIFFLL